MTLYANQTPEQVIQVEKLSKSYGKVRAVADVSFNVHKGEIFGFLGPNGAGKTTTLTILEGLQQADAGRITVLGLDINNNARQIKRRIGVQLQSTSLLPDLTVEEQMRLFARLYGRSPTRHEITTLLQQVGLDDKTAVFPEKLSGGQRQRLALALALINQPEIIFLDEPTTGLDPQSRRALWEIVQTLSDQGQTVVLTTHYMEEAEVLCDRVGIIDHGKLAALDTPGALINRLVGVSTITTSALLPLDDERLRPFISGMERNDSKIHLQTNDVASTLRVILDLAEQHQVNLNDLHIKQPGLEDVFLSLTGHTIRA